MFQHFFLPIHFLLLDSAFETVFISHQALPVSTVQITFIFPQNSTNSKRQTSTHLLFVCYVPQKRCRMAILFYFSFYSFLLPKTWACYKFMKYKPISVDDAFTTTCQHLPTEQIGFVHNSNAPFHLPSSVGISPIAFFWILLWWSHLLSRQGKCFLSRQHLACPCLELRQKDRSDPSLSEYYGPSGR